MRSLPLMNLLQTRKLFHDYFKPCTYYLVTYSQLNQVKKFSTNSQKRSKHDKNDESQSLNLTGSFGATHKVFADRDAEIIFDVSERQETINLEDLKIEEEYPDPYEGINTERGKSGVFDIEDLVLLLRKDNAKDIFVASVPSQLSYVDFIVVVTSKSNKHMKALATFVRKVYKLKKYKTDPVPKIEGVNSKDWIALDLGNIALHIFLRPARLLYDLETLWSVGPDYDEKSLSTNEDIMEQYNTFLSNLEPIENDEQYTKLHKEL